MLAPNSLLCADGAIKNLLTHFNNALCYILTFPLMHRHLIIGNGIAGRAGPRLRQAENGPSLKIIRAKGADLIILACAGV